MAAKERQKKQCSVQGCLRAARSKGLCATHYQQARRGTELQPIAPRDPRQVCYVPDCNKQVYARAMCAAHYQQWRRSGTTGMVRKRRPSNKGVRCSEPGCTTPARARGMCMKHYQRWRRHGQQAVESAAATKNMPTKDAAGKPLTCILDGCAADVFKKQMCSVHYYQWYRLHRQEEYDAALGRTQEINHELTFNKALTDEQKLVLQAEKQYIQKTVLTAKPRADMRLRDIERDEDIMVRKWTNHDKKMREKYPSPEEKARQARLAEINADEVNIY